MLGRDHDARLQHRDTTRLDAQPQLEGRRPGHTQERGPFVLQLAAFLARLTSSAGRVMDHPRAGVALVLVLPALAARAEVLDFAVVDGDAQDAFSRPWLSPSIGHGTSIEPAGD
jgi:hypothetical protein